MLHHELLRDQGVLMLRPKGKLKAEDFKSLAGVVDPYLEKKGELKGIVLEAVKFPGWENFAGLLSHLRFVRDHHRKVRRIAIVTDGKLLKAAPKIAKHFVSADVKRFEAGQREAALAWIKSS
jgi:hypothetical protein